MRAIRVKDSGVLWRLATYYGTLDSYTVRNGGADICSYTRAVLAGIVGVLFIIAVLGVCAAIVGDTLAFIAAWFVSTGHVEIGLGAFIGLALASLLAAIVALGFVKLFIDEALYAVARRKRDREEAGVEPSTLTQMYRSWKEKTCVKIEVE